MTMTMTTTMFCSWALVLLLTTLPTTTAVRRTRGEGRLSNLADFLKIPPTSNNDKESNGDSGNQRKLATEKAVVPVQAEAEAVEDQSNESRNLEAAKCEITLCTAHSLVVVEEGTIDCETYENYIFSYVFEAMYSAVMKDHSLLTIDFFPENEEVVDGSALAPPYTLSCGISGYLEVVIDDGSADDACEIVRDEIDAIWGSKITDPDILDAIVYEFEMDYREMGHDVDLDSGGPTEFECSYEEIDEIAIEPEADESVSVTESPSESMAPSMAP
eukprot:CAMPEP_0194030632 /NCGR_PEP_ID=MMETSP0009_2-20130614/4037_1 /TAXON_ID=210454 /ORGANISM="Grammatophora oceanica, Strain CCMP 410" /LENGTH=272 /DNA_ID=CAMNT_0038670607 /DNA_START=152 /DNA_END=970 /DNA_ORIENTATION=-